MGSPPTTPPRVMRGADGSNAGASGYAPAPAATDNNKALFGDGAYRAVTTTGTAATKAEADAGTDTTKYVAPDALSYALAAKRNALAPRGGLAFDGTASTRVYSPLTNQNIGTDAFSFSVTFKVPTSAAFMSLLWLTSNATSCDQSNSATLFLGGSGTLEFGVKDASGGNNAAVSSFVSTYGGKVVTVQVTRPSSGNPSIYINGVSQTLTLTTSGSAPGWQCSVTSTYFTKGYYNSTTTGAFVGTIYSASLYNLALSQADVTEIMELGGAVPERFKFGSQVGLLTGDSSTFTSGYGTWTNTGGASISATGGKLVVTTGGSWNNGAADGANVTLGKRYRVTVTVSSIVGASSVLLQGAYGTDTQALPAGTTSVEFTAVASGYPTAVITGPYGATSFSLDDVIKVRLGAVVHYDADADGIGYQLHDQSTNKLDAVLTTTGVSWTKPTRRGYIRNTHTWAGTHEAKYLWSTAGGRDLPSGAVIDLVTTKATAGSSASGLNIDANGTSIVGVNSYTTAKKVHTLANRMPGGNTDNHHLLTIDPDIANYTGSIETEIQYSKTEGAQ